MYRPDTVSMYRIVTLNTLAGLTFFPPLALWASLLMSCTLVWHVRHSENRSSGSSFPRHA